MKKKLRSGRGTTMVEMLAAVLVLIFLSMMLNTGLNLALNSYHRMISRSECQVLLSTAADTLINELRFARDMKIQPGGTSGDPGTPAGPGTADPDKEGRLVSYLSRSVGCEGNIVIWDETTENKEAVEPSNPDRTLKGQLYVWEIDPEKPDDYDPSPMLASGAYGTNGSYQIQLPDGITYNPETKIFTFTIKVYDGDEVKAQGEFTARNLSDNGASDTP